MSTPIPEEEWGLLANAVATPIPQLIAVETVDSDQRTEVMRRLYILAGSRPVMTILAQPSEGPETPWRAALRALPEKIDKEAPPLLLLAIDTRISDDPASRQRQADFWRGMNQMREAWHGLEAQTVFLLSPTAFQQLGLHAVHLKRWMAPRSDSGRVPMTPKYWIGPARPRGTHSSRTDEV